MLLTAATFAPPNGLDGCKAALTFVSGEFMTAGKGSDGSGYVRTGFRPATHYRKLGALLTR